MEKFLLGLVVVAFTSLCGYVFAGKYRRKKSFFYQLFEFNERFLGEISYAKRPIVEFARRYSYTDEFEELLEAFEKELQSEEEFFLEETIEDFSFLNDDEKIAISDYFRTIGRGDSSSQKAYFTTMKAQLGEYKKNSAQACGRYGDLYVKLGFLFGLAVMILIV